MNPRNATAYGDWLIELGELIKAGGPGALRATRSHRDARGYPTRNASGVGASEIRSEGDTTTTERAALFAPADVDDHDRLVAALVRIYRDGLAVATIVERWTGARSTLKATCEACGCPIVPGKARRGLCDADRKRADRAAAAAETVR